ncbi:MAG: amino acid adenylation domain-containing protein, partial [Candidatus Acidiferrales bacterium]
MQETLGLSESKKQLLQEYLRGGFAEERTKSLAIPRRSDDKYAPLSFSQQQVWVNSNLAGNLPVYNETMTVFKRGPLDPAILERAIGEIIRRHEIWRTTFDVVDGQPVQLVHPASSIFKIPQVDLTALPQDQRKKEAIRMASEDAKELFDLSCGPLLRATLYHLSEDDHQLFMEFHHIIFDGITAYRVFLPELAALYRAFSEGKLSPLPDPPIQYADFACWQRQHADQDASAKHLNYWKQQLQGELPILAWPNDFPRPAEQTYRGVLRNASLAPDLIQPLRDLSLEAGCSLYTTLLTGMSALLHRYTGQTDIILGGLSACRRSPESEALLGCFMNPIPLRIDLSGNLTFRELLARAREIVLGGLDHEEMPFEQIVSELRLRPDPSRNPLFQIIFALEPDVSPVDRQWDLTLEDFSNGTSKVDLSIVLDDRGERISGPMVYNPDLFEDSTIQRLMAHWNGVLRSAVANPDLPISLLEFMAPEEKQQILYEWNRTAANYPKDSCVHQLFEAQVERTPDNRAVIFDKQELTYRELNQRANQLAHRLIESGVGPDVVVGICAERSVEMIVSLLGILKAGGAYLPLDPEYPAEQLAFMLRDCGVRLVVACGASGARVPSDGITLVPLDGSGSANMNIDNPAVHVRPNNLAYVIYTSGSTGNPKGAEIEHRSIVRLLLGISYVDLDESKAILQLAPFTFDVSTFEIWGALLHGAKCVLYPGKVPSVRELGEFLRAHHITTVATTAAWFSLIIDEEPKVFSGLRQLIVGGEPLSVSHVRRAWDQLPNVELINGYGPTESTMLTTSYTVRHRPSSSATSIPIGSPIANTECYVLDTNLQPVPVGIKGELYIGGVGLARGYRNRPDLTRGSFIRNPFSDEPGSRLYKTGDAARFLPDGTIDYLGRMDDQVKIRGFRIELGQVETILRRHPKVQDAACIVTGENSDKLLIAYLVFRNGSHAWPMEIREYVRRMLPPYMVPDKFVTLNAMPLGRHGKVDRHSLPALEPTAPVSAPESAAPTDAVEKEMVQLWEKLFSRQPISCNDNFFSLGGNSLLAVKLLVRVEGAFGKRLSLASLVAAPTIRQFAAFVRANDPVRRIAQATTIQPQGTKPPFFCVGAGALFHSLVEQMGTDRPFLSLILRKDAIDKLKTPYSLEELAGHLVDAMRERQPNGPYYLGGFCQDGILAYETARQLTLRGQKVAMLFLFETVNPAPLPEDRVASQWRRTAIRLKYRRDQFRQLGASNFPQFFKLQVASARRRLTPVAWRVSHRARKLVGDAKLNSLERIVHIASRTYKPKPLSSPTLLFRCNEWPIASAGDPYFGWRSLLTGWNKTVEIPGNHAGMFRQ